MSPSQSFDVITRVPLPITVPPSAVVAALHAYTPLIEANAHLTSFERRAINIDEVVDDPFFRDDGQHLQAFLIHQRIPIIPGVGSWATKDVVVPCIFQSFDIGTRCRADASGGVTVRSSYEVRRRGEVQGGEDYVPGPQDSDYELVEVANVECSALVRPFVRKSLAGSHQELLQKIADEVAQEYLARPSGRRPT